VVGQSPELLRLSDHSQIVRTEEGDFTQQVTRRPGIGSDETDQRRRKSNPLEFDATIRKELVDFSSSNPEHRDSWDC